MKDFVNLLVASLFVFAIFIFLDGIPKMIFSGIVALVALMELMGTFQVGTFFSQTLPRQVRRFVSRVGNNDTDASRERIQFPSTNQAAPLTEVERHRNDTQFRPYEVLYHMSHDARQNLFDDALTQTIELWKNRREEQYQLLENSDVDITDFKAELRRDDNGSFRIGIVMVLGGSSEEIIELAEQFRHHFDIRITLLAQLHDSFPPNM